MISLQIEYNHHARLRPCINRCDVDVVGASASLIVDRVDVGVDDRTTAVNRCTDNPMVSTIDMRVIGEGEGDDIYDRRARSLPTVWKRCEGATNGDGWHNGEDDDGVDTHDGDDGTDDVTLVDGRRKPIILLVVPISVVDVVGVVGVVGVAI